MKNPLATMIGKATSLTQSGQLTEATALIQAALAPAKPAPPGDDSVIEGTFTEVGAAGGSPPKAASPKRPRTTSMPKSGLSETLRKIAAGGMPLGQRFQGVTPPLPQGAEFLSLSHSGPHGSRNYRLYVPANCTADMPLIVMLHGCTQTPEDFAIGTGMNTLAEASGCMIAYPGQPTGANAQKCWNWYRPEDQAKGAGEPAVLTALTRDILRDYPVDADRVYVAGLSAGGAAALIVGAAYPDVFSAVGVHSGLAIGAAQDVPSAFAAMRVGASGRRIDAAPPTIVFHGLADTTVHSDNARRVIAQTGGQSAAASHIVQQNGRRSAHVTRYGTMAELWEIQGAGHAWAGGQIGGSYTDPEGPDASAQMLRFFLEHPRR